MYLRSCSFFAVTLCHVSESTHEQATCGHARDVDLDYNGDDIPNNPDGSHTPYNSSSADDCCARCDAELQCTHWSWNPAQLCYLKSGRGIPTPKKGDISGGMMNEDAYCKAHAGCAALSPVDGLCCPVADGTRLACCDAPPAIIGGQGDWRFVYEPDRLQMPEGADPPYSHGLEVDADQNVYLTYFDSADSGRCLVRWSAADGYSQPVVVGHGSEMCSRGDEFNGPHGLRLVEEAGGSFFYHANNNQALFKTTLDGELVWSAYGSPSGSTVTGCIHGKYCPTWFGFQPGSDYVYMADGYGADQVHVYTRDGNYTGHTFGGKGTEHGQFDIPHSISWDPRRGQMVVADRTNHRLEYFDIDAENQSKFEYVSTSTVDGMEQVCNVHFWNDYAVAPTLEGFVFILDADNQKVASIDMKTLLKDEHFDHPHDAIFLPSGDIVVATWNPGRIAYWRRLPTGVALV